ncbi:DUF397 domain-containing protein [Streptomyces sp. ME19-01-6]|uniref:DUF397 domain-containing protein n=1 Tax=Streptomyces sp. ME19-01-6 TaxID=3028686 RepID=UPI0029A98F75|nr:DUF397 domain-containing protein [Streptomyces sp. ME19-01-6]MDX3233236.1 DUF397 domain-containing protein [Streptomyces sp. ME19-01-6]
MSHYRNLTSAVWIKSSYSSSSGGECVEFSPTFAASGVVPVRDSKTPQGPAVVVPADAWSSFVSAVKRGEFPST